MKKVKISAAIATYNEEPNIVDCIESLKLVADDIVVVDGQSSDRTRELANSLGARVIKTTNKKMFHINKNMAIDHCRGDWILLMDADERISAELAQEIKKVTSISPAENGFLINRRNWFLGGFLTKGGAYPDSVIRLFRTGLGRLPQISVHEQVKIDGDVGNLKNDILHFADPDFARYLRRANRYSDHSAIELGKLDPGRGLVTVLFYLSIKPILTFISIYIRHRGYVDGFRGFVWAFFSATHHFLAYVKYWNKEV